METGTEILLVDGNVGLMVTSALGGIFVKPSDRIDGSEDTIFIDENHYAYIVDTTEAGVSGRWEQMTQEQVDAVGAFADRAFGQTEVIERLIYKMSNIDIEYDLSPPRYKFEKPKRTYPLPHKGM